MVILNHLTTFSRLLARRAFCIGPADHKESTTKSSGREKMAFGGSGQPVDVVVKLVRSAGSRCVSLLAEQTDLTHQMVQYNHERL